MLVAGTNKDGQGVVKMVKEGPRCWLMGLMGLMGLIVNQLLRLTTKGNYSDKDC